MPGTNLTRNEAAQRAQLLDVTGYDVELDVTTGDKVFRSTTVVRFTATEHGSSTFVDLIAGDVQEVVLNGRHVRRTRSSPPAGSPSTACRPRTSSAWSPTLPYMNTGEGLHRFVDPVDDEVYLYSQFEVADSRRVFACFDQPDLKAPLRSPSPRRRTGRSSPSPPRRRAREPRRRRQGATWRFEPTPRSRPTSRRSIAGPYHAERGVAHQPRRAEIPLACSAAARWRSTWTPTTSSTSRGPGSRTSRSCFDLPYPFAKYDQLFVPEFNAGAMENAGAVTITEHYVFRSKVPEAMVERRALTILHELAHMWFGDLVTMRWWDDLWLNESFAEYASTRCQAEATRWATRLDDVHQRGEVLGLPAGPARDHAPRRRRHPRPGGRRGQLRRHHLRQGRAVLKQLVALGRARGVRRAACAGTSARTRGATRRCATCWPSSRPPAGATSTHGPDSGCEQAGVTTLRPITRRSGRRRDTSFAVVQAGARRAPGAAPAPPRGRRLRPRRRPARALPSASSSTSTATAPTSPSFPAPARPRCCS